MNIFEQASRQRTRIKAQNGMLSVEDLWDIPLSQLDRIAQGLRRELREVEDSFIEKKQNNADLELKFELVKHVIETRMAERDAQKQEKEISARRQVLLAALEEKEKQELSQKSSEELRKELDNLGN